MWSRNTVRESSHISFFCGRDNFCEIERRPKNTQRVADTFAEITCESLLQSKITYLMLSFKSHAEIWTWLLAHIFSVYGWVSEFTYICCCFFRVICWSYLRTEISVILSTGNKLYSRHFPLFFIFPVKPLFDVILRPLWIY